jgi:hypothetical protein
LSALVQALARTGIVVTVQRDNQRSCTKAWLRRIRAACCAPAVFVAGVADAAYERSLAIRDKSNLVEDSSLSYGCAGGEYIIAAHRVELRRGRFHLEMRRIETGVAVNNGWQCCTCRSPCGLRDAPWLRSLRMLGVTRSGSVHGKACRKPGERVLEVLDLLNLVGAFETIA